MADETAGKTVDGHTPEDWEELEEELELARATIRSMEEARVMAEHEARRDRERVDALLLALVAVQLHYRDDQKIVLRRRARMAGARAAAEARDWVGVATGGEGEGTGWRVTREPAPPAPAPGSSPSSGSPSSSSGGDAPPEGSSAA